MSKKLYVNDAPPGTPKEDIFKTLGEAVAACRPEDQPAIYVYDPKPKKVSNKMRRLMRRWHIFDSRANCARRQIIMYTKDIADPAQRKDWRQSCREQRLVCRQDLRVNVARRAEIEKEMSDEVA